MAANLVKAGYRVLGFDLMPAALEQATTDGVHRRRVLRRGRRVLPTSSSRCCRRASTSSTLYQGLLPRPSRARCSSTAPPSTSPRPARQRRSCAAGRTPCRRRAGLRRRRRARRRARWRSWSADRTEDFEPPTAARVMGAKVVHCGDRRRAGREDLQQHDPRHLDDRGQRGVRPRREAGAEPPGVLRRRVQRVGAVLGADQPTARCPDRCPPAPPTTTTSPDSPTR